MSTAPHPDPLPLGEGISPFPLWGKGGG